MLLIQSQQPRSGFLMIEVLFAVMLLSIAVCSWGSFWAAMLDRLAKAQERALGYACARSYMARFKVEGGATSFVDNNFEITLRRFKRFGRFDKVVLEVKGTRDTFYIHTGMCR